MSFYEHQQSIINEDPAYCGLWLGTGSGKTKLALALAKGTVLVICPKTQKEDGNWERAWEDSDVHDNGDKTCLTVISKETFRRDAYKLDKYHTVIVDEAHTCLGVTPNVRYLKKMAIPKTSQLFEELDAYLARTNPHRLYLLTATIMKSPMTVWGAAKLLGYNVNWFDFREQYYFKLPMPGYREVWIPKNESSAKDSLAELVKSLGKVGRLEDFFDVPEQTHKTIYVELTDVQKGRIKDIKIDYPDPIVQIGKIHQIENGILSGDEFNSGEHFTNEKIGKIVELSIEFPRMVIFAKYRAQIDEIARCLTKERKNVLVLTGDTKDRGDVLKDANEAKECIFVAQAQISAGWELPDYPVMVFASRTYSFVDFDQAIGRIQRANNIKKNLYIYLVIKGGVDERVDKCLRNKQDFNERLYELE